MQSRVMLTCLVFILSSSLWAQSSASSQTQPSSSAQAQADHDKPADSDRDHKVHVRLGTVSLAAGYTHFSGPFFFYPFSPYGYYPYSFAYAPFLYDPFYGPFYSPYPRGFAYAPDKGEIKLNSNPKNAQVFVDGAYAGTADHLKTLWLDSGAYDLTLSAPGRETFQKRIYVLSGKSLKIDAPLAPQKEKLQTEEKP